MGFQVSKRNEYKNLSLENSLQPSVLSTSKWPLIEGKTLNGHSHEISAPGDWTLVHLWATWCAPCRQELPELDKFAFLFQKKIKVLAVSVDEDREQLEKFMGKYPAPNLNILHEPTGVLEKELSISKYPETFLLGPNGQISGHYSGPRSWLDPSIVRYFEELIRKT